MVWSGIRGTKTSISPWARYPQQLLHLSLIKESSMGGKEPGTEHLTQLFLSEQIVFLYCLEVKSLVGLTIEKIISHPIIVIEQLKYPVQVVKYQYIRIQKNELIKRPIKGTELPAHGDPVIFLWG